MSKGFSSASFVGGLGKDPEIRHTQSGKKVASFSLAVEDGFGDKATTHWFNFVAWDALADFTEKYLKKGKSVAVIAKIQNRSWDDKTTGAKRTVTEFVAKDISFFDTGSGGSGGATRAAAPPARREAEAPATRAAANDDPFGEEEPF